MKLMATFAQAASRPRPGHFSALILITVLLSVSVAAQQTVRIDELSLLDRQYMAAQKATLDDLARVRLGRQFSGDKSNDLSLLQALLDHRLVRAEQTKELQAMGVIMGELFAHELHMHWVIYEDNIGRSRALRYRNSDNYLFPMTMISSRREVDNMTPVADIYQRALDLIVPQLPKLPFR